MRGGEGRSWEEEEEEEEAGGWGGGRGSGIGLVNKLRDDFPALRQPRCCCPPVGMT